MTTNGRLPPGQKEASNWPVLHYGEVPSSEISSWDFRIWGAVDNPLTLSYEEFRRLPVCTVKADFHCVTRFSVLDNEWEGVAFREVAALARLTTRAQHLMFHCESGYEANLPLDVVMDEDVLFAWGRNGEPLTPEHGYPLRLIVPKRYGWKSAKWVRGVEFMTADRKGFWEERGYNNRADPWREERYTNGGATHKFWNSSVKNR